MDINEIARRAGVSRATVSRYLNNGYVSKEKRELIGRIIEETGYVPSQHAQTLRTGKTKLVGVIIPKINSASVSRMVNGITNVLAEGGYQSLLGNTDNDESVEVEYLNLFAERNRVDGIILIATVFTPAHLQAFERIDVPVVILGQQLPGHFCVYNDDYHAVYTMTSQVIESGSTHPAYIGVLEDDESAGHQRHMGFLDACHAAGLEVPDVAQAVGDFTVDSGYACCEHLLDAVPELDAVICATDEEAFGAITCLREYDHDVPGQVQVTGIGDNAISSISYPSLTTVHHYYETSGREAAKMLLDAMGSSADAVPREIKMSYEVCRRESTR